MKPIQKIYLSTFFLGALALFVFNTIFNFIFEDGLFDWVYIYKAGILSLFITGSIYLVEKSERKKLGLDVIYDNDNNMIVKKTFLSDASPDELMQRMKGDYELKKMNPERTENVITLTVKRPKSKVNVTAQQTGDQYEYIITMPATYMKFFSNLQNCGKTIRSINSVM